MQNQINQQIKNINSKEMFKTKWYKVRLATKKKTFSLCNGHWNGKRECEGTITNNQYKAVKLADLIEMINEGWVDRDFVPESVTDLEVELKQLEQLQVQEVENQVDEVETETDVTIDETPIQEQNNFQYKNSQLQCKTESDYDEQDLIPRGDGILKGNDYEKAEKLNRYGLPKFRNKNKPIGNTQQTIVAILNSGNKDEFVEVTMEEYRKNRNKYV